MRFRLLAAALFVLPFCLTARADVVATLPPSGTSPSTDLGTFSFSVPAGDSITSATIDIQGFGTTYNGSTDFYLDGIFLGTLGASAFSAASTSYNLTDLSILSDGAADLTIVVHNDAGAPFVLGTGGESLAITVTPEPSSFMLLGTGLLGVLGVAERRFA